MNSRFEKSSGAQKNRTQGASDSRRIHGSGDNRRVRGSDENRRTWGADENRGTRGTDEYRRTRDANENRRMQGAKESRMDKLERGRNEDNDRRQPWKKHNSPATRTPPKRYDSHDIQAKTDENDKHEDFDKLEGRNSILEALKSGRSINKIFVAKGEKEGSMSQIMALAKQSKIVVQEVDRTRLDNMSTTHAHQGVIAFVAAKDYVEVDDILEMAEKSGAAPFIIVLDEITDAYNLGSVLRTANAAGAHGVIIPKRRAIGLTAAVSKASSGAIEYVPVARVTNIPQTVEYLKKKNIWIVGTDSTGEKAFYQHDLTGPIALVIGSEGEGMGKLVRESCDFVVNIPMKGQISSLNAAVAGAIVMYEILKQRSNKE